MGEGEKPKGFFQSLGGFLTALAGLITAIVSLLVILQKLGYIGGHENSDDTKVVVPLPEPQPQGPQLPAPQPQPPAPQPQAGYANVAGRWRSTDGAIVFITQQGTQVMMTDGESTAVQGMVKGRQVTFNAWMGGATAQFTLEGEVLSGQFSDETGLAVPMRLFRMQ
jgi:hypothetical protein